ncbi:hypothetical protein B0H13DRAFT_2346771 [Mycena leptocephala]|nr:hypothetical protein B0H13DRAFT_2346771 [Mycena leptocephala]
MAFDSQATGRERESAGVGRNPRHGMAARPAPYDMASRSRRSRISSNDEASPGPSSLTSGASTSSSARAPPVLAGGTFITAETVNHHHHRGEDGIKILHQAVALEALYDSADSFPQPRCHPETRTKMLDGLYKWAIQGNSSQPISIAGRGSPRRGLLFKRGHTTRGNAKVLFATLAYQLAFNNHQLKPLISRNVEEDLSIVGRDMNVQLRKLVVEPCKSLRDSAAPILLIDGLDECDTHRAQIEILCLIASAVSQDPNIFQILIASRPEAHIRNIFEKPSFRGILHSVNVEQSFADIRKYLRDEFSRIHREHQDTMSGILTPWPSPEILDNLVEKSSGYFIYASTVIKFIDDEYSRPTDRLAAVQNLTPSDPDAPFEVLDQLYMQILSVVPANSPPN